MSAARPRRRGHLLIAAIALVLGLWGVRGLWNLSALPADLAGAGIRYPARIGDIAVGSPAELRFIIQSRPAGTDVTIRTPEETLRPRLVPQLSRPHFYLVLLEGLLFLAVSVTVFRPRLDRGPVRDFYWCTLLYGVAILIGGLYFPRAPSWTEWILPIAWIACLGFLPVFFLHMSLTFPRRSAFLGRFPAVTALLAAVATVLVLWQSVVYARYFLEPGPAAWRTVLLPRALAEGFLVLSVAAGCLVLYLRARSLEFSRDREQVKWLLWGFTVGVTPYVFLRTLPRLLGLPPPLPAEFDRLAELAIPLAFTLAVVRYRFLDIDIIIRRSLIYGILAGVLTVAYLVAGVTAARAMERLWPDSGEVFRFLAVAVPVILFAPTRRWIGTWVDRTFFKIRYDHDRAVSALRRSLQTSASPEELAGLLQEFLRRELALKEAAVLLRRDEGWIEASSPARVLRNDSLERLERLLLPGPPMVAAPGATSLPERERDDGPAAPLGWPLAIAMPLLGGGDLLGMVLVGTKTSERRFVKEDLQLLEQARDGAAAALERMVLIRKVFEDAEEQRRLQDLERMKSRFLANTAHDLRTPLTSIRWTLQNLLDEVLGPLDARHVSALESIQAATNQLARLTANILDVSRLEKPDLVVEAAPVVWEDVVRTAAEGLRPLADVARVRLDVRADEGLPPVCGDRGKLIDVASNLIENAIRYSPPGAAVAITLAASGTGRQALTVRDRGPGLAGTEEERARIFDQFYQGPPSPHTPHRGAGLGLYIVRAYVERMRGSVRAGNHPDGGAEFVCELPVWDAA